jgi:hypothetical protein
MLLKYLVPLRYRRPNRGRPWSGSKIPHLKISQTISTWVTLPPGYDFQYLIIRWCRSNCATTKLYRPRAVMRSALHILYIHSDHTYLGFHSPLTAYGREENQYLDKPSLYTQSAILFNFSYPNSQEFNALSCKTQTNFTLVVIPKWLRHCICLWCCWDPMPSKLS